MRTTSSHAPDFEAMDQDGNPVIAENAHLRLAAPENNDGAQILRRAYSYNDGANFTAERWPPWRQGIEYDAGLFFVAYQRDPRTGFIRIFENMAKIDALNQFTTHVGSGLFACPGGIGGGTIPGAGPVRRGIRPHDLRAHARWHGWPTRCREMPHIGPLERAVQGPHQSHAQATSCSLFSVTSAVFGWSNHGWLAARATLPHTVEITSMRGARAGGKK